MAILTVMDVFPAEPSQVTVPLTGVADQTDLQRPLGGEACKSDLKAMSPPVRTVVSEHSAIPVATGLLPTQWGGGRVLCSLGCERGAGSGNPGAWWRFLLSGPASGPGIAGDF